MHIHHQFDLAFSLVRVYILVFMSGIYASMSYPHLSFLVPFTPQTLSIYFVWTVQSISPKTVPEISITLYRKLVASFVAVSFPPLIHALVDIFFGNARSDQIHRYTLGIEVSMWNCATNKGKYPVARAGFNAKTRTFEQIGKSPQARRLTRLSTSLFLCSSSKNSISSYLIPVAFCRRLKCVILLPG